MVELEDVREMELADIKRRKLRLQLEMKVLSLDNEVYENHSDDYYDEHSYSVLFANCRDVDSEIEKKQRQISELDYQIIHYNEYSVYRWLT